MVASTPFTKHATALGRYWVSDVSHDGLRRRLRALDQGLFKRADLGGDPDEEFERSFSSLAYGSVKSKAPKLLQYIVGFQLIERDEDNTKAVGVFGFKAGDMWLYAPVFFLSGDLKGTELLYVKDEDSFVPLKENWINFLLSRKPHQLGEPSQQDTHQLGGLLPNLSRLARLPTGTKYGSDAGATLGGRHIGSGATGFLPFYAAAATWHDKLLVKHAASAQQVDLRRVLTDPYLFKLAHDWYQRFPGIKRGFDRFYGPAFFAQHAAALRGELRQRRHDLGKLLTKTATVEHDTRQRAGHGVPRRVSLRDSLLERPAAAPHPIKSGALQIIRLHDVWPKTAAENEVDPNTPLTVNKPELTDAEREKLLNDTVLIKDRRDPHAVSMAYNTQIRMALINPTDTGVYDLLQKPGDFDKALVIAHPHAGNGRQGFATVFRQSDPRAWLNTHNTNLWVRTETDDADEKTTRSTYQTWFDKQTDADLKKDGHYLFVGPNGDGTLPFRVKESYGDGAYRVSWKDSCDYGNDRPNFLPRRLGFNSSASDPDNYSSWDAKLTINKRDDAKLRSVGGELFVPKNFKAIKLQDPPPPPRKSSNSLLSYNDDSEAVEQGAGTEPLPIEPGNLADVQMMLYNKLARLELHDLGAGEIYLKSPLEEARLSKTAALLSLVAKHGFREAQARQMLKEAAAGQVRNQAAKYLVKYAYPYYADGGLLQPGPTAPAFPPPMQGAEQVGYKSFPAVYPQEHFLPVPGLDSNLTDPSIYDPFYMPESDQLAQAAEQASDNGQKEVFDTSMLGGMLKAVRQESLVDRYMGDLMNAVDKLGRIFFMLLWHQEDFAERYGQSELPEMEDAVRNAFEAVADVTLWFLNKDVSGGRQPNRLPRKSEPSIDETAMN